MVLDLCIMLESVGVANRPYPMTKILGTTLLGNMRQAHLLT